MEDFRPISLSNSSYLIIANRLRGVIGKLVGPFQSAFISGRLLVDSITIAGEIIADWQRKGTKGFMQKVDFADLDAWRCCFHVECEAVLPDSAEVLPNNVRGMPLRRRRLFVT